MKVGIMSMQRIYNNGSFLQSYSMKKNLEQMGHEVVFVDYEIGKNLLKEEVQKENKLVKVKNKVVNKARRMLKLRKNESEALLKKQWEDYAQNENDFNNNVLPLLGVGKNYVYRPVLDVLVIGSDEVFNCLQPNDQVGYSPQLFGAENRAKKVISYAATFGNTTGEGLRQYGIEQEVAGYLKQMDAISVRDAASVKLTKHLTGIQPYYHVDPVFLYDYSKEMKDSVDLKDYIVVYSYWDRISEPEAEAVIKFAKKKHKKIITLAGPQRYVGEFVKASPFEVLSYMKNADYIITDTFHGSVFSIKFNKKFVALIREGTGREYGNSNKLLDLLERFGLSDRKISDMGDMEQMLEQEIDYAPVNEKIAQEREKSLEYLKKYVN